MDELSVTKIYAAVADFLGISREKYQVSGLQLVDRQLSAYFVLGIGSPGNYKIILFKDIL
jgi:hypothetical protein